VRAYVLIQTELPGQALAEKLLELPGVLAAEDLSGAYDAIALARAGSSRDLGEQILSEILRLPGVTRALPAPVIASLNDRPGALPTDRGSDTGDRAA
jgi:DNA-binding Lrp family transcriptional regulator